MTDLRRMSFALLATALATVLAAGGCADAAEAPRMDEAPSPEAPKGVRGRLIEVATRATAEDAALFDGAEDYADADVQGVRFAFDRALARRLKNHQPEHLRVTVPTSDGPLHLDLYRARLVADTFVVDTDGGALESAVDGVHYRGVVDGAEASLASISVYDDGVAGFISTGARLFNLARLRGSDDHVAYQVDELPVPAALGCNIDEIADPTPVEPLRSSQAFVGEGKYVSVYFEADFKMFQDHASSVTETTDYITAFFNQVATLYANESIDLRIASIFVWTTPDPYANLNGTFDVLDAFQRATGTSFPGNLAFFLTTRPLNGGVAYVDVLCAKSYAFGMAMVYNTFASVPTYSWTVEAVAHELGHNFGSPHTQACSWQGGALDNCVAPEGSCSAGPAPTNGGTVMSYCHLTSAGINFNNGFGQQPGDLLRSRVINASCLSTGTPPPPPPPPPDDTSAPTVSVTTAATTITAHTTLAIQATASDDVGVARVEFFKNGALAGTDTSAPYTFSWSTSSEANGAFAFTARAYDAAGNSTLSSEVTMTLDVAPVAVDAQAPTAPTNLAATRKNRTAKLSWRAATDNVGVTAYLVLRNGVVIGTTTSTAASAGLLFGNNTFTIQARDAAGNLSAASNAVTLVR